MGIRSSKHLLVLISAILVSTSIGCSSFSCQKKAAASDTMQRTAIRGKNLPFSSFVKVENNISFEQGKCEKGKKCIVHKTRFFGSGVVIYRSKKKHRLGYVLTARHVCGHKSVELSIPKRFESLLSSPKLVKPKQRFVVIDNWGIRHKAIHYFSVDRDKVDACVLIVKEMNESITHVNIASRPAEPGEKVFNIAAPGGFTIDRGGLVFTGYYAGDMTGISVYTISVAHGSSGSPIFNQFGELLGMIWGYPLKRGTDSRIIDQLAFSLQLIEITNIMSSIESSDPLIEDLLPIIESK